MATGSWTGTTPRGVYKPAMNEKEGNATTGAWKNFDTSLANIHNKLWAYNWRVCGQDYATLNAAVTAISTTECTLVIMDNQTLTVNTTIPSTLHLFFMQGGKITLGAKTLTINGPMDAPISQIFDDSGAGSVSFGRGSVEDVYVEWWGPNTTPGTTDMSAEFQSCLDSIKTNSSAGTSLLATKYYVTISLDGTMMTSWHAADPLLRYEGVRISGRGSGLTKIIGKLAVAKPILDFTGSTGVHLEGVQIYGDPTGSQSAGILFAREETTARGDRPYLEDVEVQGKFSKATIGFISADLSTMLHCSIYNSADARVLVYSPTDVDAITSAYQTISTSSTANTKHELYGCNIIAQGDTTGALRFDAGAEITINSSYFSLQADAGVQAAIETTGTGGNQINAHNIRMENSDNGATYHLITFTTSSTGGYIQGNADINGTDAIFNIPAGKSITGYYLNVTLATSAGREYIAGGGHLKNSYVINSQNLAATLGSSSYGNIILMNSGTNLWDLSNAGIVINGAGQLELFGKTHIRDRIYSDYSTLADGETNIDLSLGHSFVTSANTGATAIATASNVNTIGQKFTVVGGSDTNATTFSSVAGIKTQGAFTCGVYDTIKFIVNPDGVILEISRNTWDGG